MIFNHILQEAMNHGFVNPEVIFIDSTHVKANANKKKYVKKLVWACVRTFQKQLEDEIN
jgi:hypothetical protein